MDETAMTAEAMVEAYLAETRRSQSTLIHSYESGRRILAASPEMQARILAASFVSLDSDHDYRGWFSLGYLQKALLKNRLPLQEADVEAIAAFLTRATFLSRIWKPMLGAIEDFAATSPLTDSMRRNLERAKEERTRLPASDRPAFECRVNALIGVRRLYVVDPTDDWGKTIVAAVSTADAARRAAIVALLDHCHAGVASKPSARWLKTAEALISGIPDADFPATLLKWLQTAEGLIVVRPDAPSRAVSDLNQEIVRGLICATATIREKDAAARCLGRLALWLFCKAPQAGVGSLKLGNACLFALGQIASETALGQIVSLKARVKSRSVQKEVEKALNGIAVKLNVSREELEELGVPSYGFVEVGRLEEPLGDFTAELTIADRGRVSMVWRKPDGRLQKSIPVSVREQHAEELKDLKARAKDIEKLMPAQRERLDNLFLQQRRWSADVWRERYLDHPLVGILARRLIWSFKNTGLETAGSWLGDTVVDVDDEPIDWIDADGTTVELWHPIGRPMDDVLSWRHWLERHEVRQPFKQAHREVYVLTDAERRTGTYSNRYAAHILRQHQFNALCAARAWANKLRLMVDADYSAPTKRLENWGLRAEFWVDTIGDHYGTDTTDFGAFLYLSTDQVRFYRLEADRHIAHATGGRFVTEGLDVPLNQPLPLELIPPMAFSEVMRDVDLFVGVASVGNDPTWADGGPDGRYREYWQNFSFGDLTPTAQTRKQVLERLVPRLKIGERCSFSEKFLVVRGELRTYKIHLGSGNILMEPNDQYLCIVPDSSAASKGDSVFLPFEGDRTLSIILSKAMLLADDRKITDPTITRQIGAR